MADFTQSITNSLSPVGPGPTSQWGTMVWGVDYWGSGSADLVCAVEKLLTNSSTFDSSIAQLALDHVISETLSVASETTNEGLADGSGYSYVFVGPATNAESRDQSNYTSGTAQSSTWTSGSAGSTSWS